MVARVFWRVVGWSWYIYAASVRVQKEGVLRPNRLSGVVVVAVLKASQCSDEEFREFFVVFIGFSERLHFFFEELRALPAAGFRTALGS